MQDRNLLTLPSFNFVPRNSAFFIVSDLPCDTHANFNARRVVGFEPKAESARYWHRAA